MSRCAACGRRLRRKSPSGLGPVCEKRLGITAPPSLPARASPATTPAPHVEGQTEIPLVDHQPTLWSI